MTAKFVANGIWWAAQHPRLSVEVPEPMRIFNREMVSQYSTGLWSTGSALGRQMLRLKVSMMQHLALPGFYLHFVLRKRCIENAVKDAIQDGAEHLIVIGAGFDTLGLRISSRFPDVSVLEIDHPATQAWKQKALRKLGPASAKVSLLPVDLTECSLQEALLSHRDYDQNRSAVFVVEGVTMYLAENEVRDIFAFVKNAASPASRVVFTYMQENSRGKFYFEKGASVSLLLLKWLKEEFKWGVRRDALPSFLEQSGFKLLEHNTYEDLRERFLSPGNMSAALARGENVAVAQVCKEEGRDND